jgi:general secretion pathway protein D
VVVKDSDSVVIGGLIGSREEDSINKIPFLGDIPLLGYLFKTKSTNHIKTNLLLILTPRIIKNAADMAAVTEKQKCVFEGTVPGMKIDLNAELMK